ncbi:MAG: hypothetical protein K8S25_09555 [Alphaproteobacteria bacterium]|nr:hypothetical protein [Alphaproteobacteria bacterium]
MQNRADAPVEVPMIWRGWLLAVAGGVIALSLVLLLAPSAGGFLFDAIYLATLTPQTDYSPPAVAQIQFTSGVLGAVMIGWMVVIILLVQGPFRRGERFGWDAIAASVGVWFAVDTSFSLVHDVVGNVVLNLLVAAGFAVPLVATYGRFRR